MNMPFRHSKPLPKPLPMRMLNAVAATAGAARGAVRRHAQPVQPKSRNPVARVMRRG